MPAVLPLLLISFFQDLEDLLMILNFLEILLLELYLSL